MGREMAWGFLTMSWTTSSCNSLAWGCSRTEIDFEAPWELEVEDDEAWAVSSNSGEINDDVVE